MTNSKAYKSSVDPEEVEQFSKIAEEWWDASGKFKPLHEINPVRIQYIRDAVVAHYECDKDSIKPLDGLTLLDIGCGGGLISEPMARLGADVTGADASEKNIKTASVHASSSDLEIEYLTTTAENLVQQGRQFQVVLALEIIEHVVDPQAFIASCAALVAPGGLLVMTTLNRTLKSYAFAIVGAEYIMRLLPKGTHQWQKFVKPSEMREAMLENNLKIQNVSGMVLDPIRWKWRLSDTDLDVNYLICAEKSYGD